MENNNNDCYVLDWVFSFDIYFLELFLCKLNEKKKQCPLYRRDLRIVNLPHYIYHHHRHQFSSLRVHCHEHWCLQLPSKRERQRNGETEAEYIVCATTSHISFLIPLLDVRFPTHPLGVLKCLCALLTNFLLIFLQVVPVSRVTTFSLKKMPPFLQIFYKTWHSQVIWYKYIYNIVCTFHQGFQILLHTKNTSGNSKKRNKYKAQVLIKPINLESLRSGPWDGFLNLSPHPHPCDSKMQTRVKIIALHKATYLSLHYWNPETHNNWESIHSLRDSFVSFFFLQLALQ